MTNLNLPKRTQYSGEITSNRHFDGLTVGTTAYRKGTANDTLHAHDNPTICFLLEGGGIERKNRNIYERPACDVRFYHAGELHQSIIKVFPSKCVNLELEPLFLNQYEIPENIINLAVTGNLDVTFLMLKIHGELMADDSFTNSSIKILFLSMLNETRTLSNRKKPAWLVKLHELLNDRWSEQLDLEDLSLAVNVHPVTISKHFTKYFSCTLGEYMRKLKVGKSIYLIKNTRLSLTEIALQCGFADQSHFIRNFKKMTGLLPKDFKQS